MVDRRRFLRTATACGLAGLASGCARTYRYRAEKLPRNEGKDGFLIRVDELKENMATLVYSRTGPVLIVKSGGAIRAYESVCPHTMCELNDGEAEQPIRNGEIRCWIHDSYFDKETGGYISGPANPKGRLPEFKIRVEDGRIYRG